MIVLGLTGSIGMGKSTTASMFRSEGIPVHDSDACVHALYRGAAVPVLTQLFPNAMREGKIDRSLLGAEVLGNSAKLRLLESVIHPLVENDRRAFIQCLLRTGARLVVVDIPLLFEIGGEDKVDTIVVSSAPDEVQETRVLARQGMTREKFLSIKSKQVENSEKRQRAHYIVDTSLGFDSARCQVKAILRSLAHVEG